MSFVTVNPMNGEIIKVHQFLQFEESIEIVKSVSVAQKKWMKYSIQDRARILNQVAEKMLAEAQGLSQLLSLETGKTIDEAKAEIEKSAMAFRVYSETYFSELEQVNIQTSYQISFTQINPLGVVLAIMPWNYPIWQLTRVLAPAMLLGNAVLVKPAEITAGTNQLYIDILNELIPVQVIQQVMVNHQTLAQMMTLKQISAVTLTGSSEAGKKVAQLCGENLKKCVLELGGSDAYIIMSDADIDISVQECIKARLVNYGQSCIAGKRFFISELIYDQFKEKLLRELNEISDRVLAHKKFQMQVQEQVEKLTHVGGRILKGGILPLGAGAHYPVTVIEFDHYHSSIGQEEIFAPVFCLIPFRNEEEVFEFANETRFGLGSALFTQRVEEAKIWAKEKLEVGMVSINEQLKSDPRLPFGGVKDSGFGRELSRFALYEFANVKTVVGRNV